MNSSQVVLVDSAAIFALFNKADPDHQRAVSILNDLEEESASVFMTNFIRAETYTLIGARASWDLARRWLRESDLPVERVKLGDEERAVEILLSYQDQSFSFVDATSFSVMERLNVKRAFTFDEDFRTFGIQVLGLKS